MDDRQLAFVSNHWDKLPLKGRKLMYELEYVKKRRRRKAAAIVSGIASIGIAALIIVSFLGRFVGTFTVALNNDKVKLSLSEKQSFQNQTSFLRINDLPRYEENTYKSLPDDDVLDTEATSYLSGKNQSGSLDYFKYTFYVKNVGTTSARYNMSINITDSKMSKDGTSRILDDTLRVKVYETDLQTGITESNVYAKAAKEYNYDKDGNKTLKEFVSEFPYDNKETDEYPLAEMFVNSKTICTIPAVDFHKNYMKRYTLVTWLEGEDPQSEEGTLPPKDASIKIGVEITAYENQKS